MRYSSSVLVLGMHRSGTSALARVLMLLGGDVPSELLAPSPNNERGFWESPVINALDNNFLAARGLSWHSVLPIPSAAPSPDELAAIRDAVYCQFGDVSRPILKDPRICRLAPIWIEALNDCSDELLFPFILRNPVEVAASLSARNAFSTNFGLVLALRYLFDAEVSTRGQKRGVVTYDALVADWRYAIAGLERQIGSPLTTAAADEGAVDSFLSSNLQRQKSSDEETHRVIGEYALIRDGWAEFREWSDRGFLGQVHERRLDKLRNDFDRIGPLLNTILEENRILEKRQSDSKRRQELARSDGHDTQVDKAQQAKLLDDLEARLADMLRLSDKRMRGKLDEILEADLKKRSERDEELARFASQSDEIKRMSQAISEKEAAHAIALEQLSLLQAHAQDAKVSHDWEIQMRDERIVELKAEQARTLALLEKYTLLNNEREAALKEAVARHEVELARSRERAEEAKSYYDREMGIHQLHINKLETECRRFEALLLEQTALRNELQAALAASDARCNELLETGKTLTTTLEEKTLKAEQDASTLRSTASELDKILIASAEVKAELKDVVRKYRSTQATLLRTKSALDISRAQEEVARSELSALNDEINQLRNLWYIRFALWIEAVINLAKQYFVNRKRRQRRLVDLVASSGLFDGAWYLDRYDDVRVSGADPLAHYMTTGWKENRDPCPDFSVSRYLRDNPDVAAAGINPLLHYVEFGISEGRGVRRSKLTSQEKSNTLQFSTPAPVFVPTPLPGVDKEACHGKVVAQVADLDLLATLCSHDPISLAAITRFQVFSASPNNLTTTEDLPVHSASPIEDAWFTNAREIRLRTGQNGPTVAAFQNIAGSVRALSITTDGEFADVTMASPYHPLLLVFGRDQATLHALTIVFPSLFRGGTHYLDYLETLAGPEQQAVSGILELSDTLAVQTLAIRNGSAKPLVSCIAVELAGAKGTGKLFDPTFRAWLREIFDIPIGIQTPSSDQPTLTGGENYLARMVAQDGKRSGCGTLIMHCDMLPTLSILSAYLESDEAVTSARQLSLSHVVSLTDTSQPALIFLAPFVPQLSPKTGARRYTHGPVSIVSSSPIRRRPPIAAIATRHRQTIDDAQLLFPIASSIPLVANVSEGIRLILACAESIEEHILFTCEALAMQACADIVELAIIGAPQSAEDRARSLFGTRVSAHESWHEAVTSCEQPLCGIIEPGTVLHDWRTLSLLAQHVAAGAATSSCPIVETKRAGKGWVSRIINNGLIVEGAGSSHIDTYVKTTSLSWGDSYPIRKPMANLWLSTTELVKRWTQADSHRLDRADGAHWCIGATSASILPDIAVRPPVFEPPIADPACSTMVRVVHG